MKDFVKFAMFIYCIMFFIAAVVWIFTKPGEPWLWFSRVALSIFCMAVVGIIDTIEKK